MHNSVFSTYLQITPLLKYIIALFSTLACSEKRCQLDTVKYSPCEEILAYIFIQQLLLLFQYDELELQLK